MKKSHIIFYSLNILLITTILIFTFKPSIEANINAFKLTNSIKDISFPKPKKYSSKYGIIKNYQLNVKYNDKKLDNLKINIIGGSFLKIFDQDWSYSDSYENFHSTKLFRYLPNPKNIEFIDLDDEFLFNFSINHISIFDKMNIDIVIPNIDNIDIFLIDLNNNSILSPIEINRTTQEIYFTFINEFHHSSFNYFYFVLILIFLPFIFIYLLYKLILS